MLDRDYTVKYITSKNSFIYLSDQDFRLLDQDILIRLSYGINKTSYFSLGPPLSYLKAGELGICSLLGKELGIFKNDTVTLSSTTYISSIQTFNISPGSQDDYEILALLSDNVQSTLLNQVRIVHNNQKLVIWISNSLHVTVNIDGVSPISPGRLENLTEVVVIQPHLNHFTDNNFKYTTKKRGSFTAKQSILNTYNKSQTVCRLHPILDLSDQSDTIYFKQPFNIFIAKQFLPAHFDEDVNTVSSIILVNLRIINQLVGETDKTNLAVRIFALEDIIIDYRSNLKYAITFANTCIFDYLNAKAGSKIILEPLQNKIEAVKAIEIQTMKKYFGKAEELIRTYLTQNCKKCVFLINSNFVLETNDFAFSLKLTPDTEMCLIDSDVMRNVKLCLSETELVIDNNKKSDTVPDVQLCLDCCNFNRILDDTQKCLEIQLVEFKDELSNVLIVGKPGTGKSSLINHFAQIIAKPQHHVYVENIDCKKLKGKNIESLQKVLNSIFLNLIYYQPSLLILDDLHVVCEKVVEGDAPSQENIQFNKVSEMLADLFENYLQTNCISILATSESVMKLNHNIFTTRGKHLFKNVFSIDDLNKADRITIINYLYERKEVDCENIDYDSLAVKTEGFVIQDLIDFVDKSIFESYKQNVDTNITKISNQNCEDALKNTSSLSLREIQLHSPGDRKFEDVGGLENVKKILIECMMWPAQYPNIFGKAPLRLQSGLLLYGPPGTGKTILAGAAAKHCNLRLISIKGPELLSKYIGASEQAVRDVFQKAQSARPCILFFDEFDSLAPRRGHDSTGVTDRVVNQFLTQLDGVESLSGVCVLAATSRPDLLDPALLRPGRLDRQILCPLPDKTSRSAILKALSKSVKFAKGVNLENLAECTEGYSGADLQAVLYTAQLSSVEHLLQEKEVNQKSPQKETLITQKHLDDAIRTTRPSLTSDEKRRYERIYTKFQGKGDLLDLKSGNQRATLA